MLEYVVSSYPVGIYEAPLATLWSQPSNYGCS